MSLADEGDKRNLKCMLSRCTMYRDESAEKHLLGIPIL